MFVAPARARNAYVANNGDGTASVLNLSTGVPPAGTIPGRGLGRSMWRLRRDGAFAYVTNSRPMRPSPSSPRRATPWSRRFRSPSLLETAGASPFLLTGRRPGSPTAVDGTVSVIFTDTNTLSWRAHSAAKRRRVETRWHRDLARRRVRSSSPRGNANDVAILSAATRAVVGNVVDASAPSQIAIGPRGGRAFVTDSGSTSVTAFNPVHRGM